MCVPIEQDEPFDKQAGSGKMKHNLLVIRNLSTGQKTCFSFDWVLRRRRRGSGTTRKPHRYWCVYDYERNAKNKSTNVASHALRRNQRIEKISLDTQRKQNLKDTENLKSRETSSQTTHSQIFFRPVAPIPSPFISLTAFLAFLSQPVHGKRGFTAVTVPPDLWHSEHKERGETRDSDLAPHASLISWHRRSIDKWQLSATPTSQSSRKKVVTSLDQFCPTTSMAR